MRALGFPTSDPFSLAKSTRKASAKFEKAEFGGLGQRHVLHSEFR